MNKEKKSTLEQLMNKDETDAILADDKADAITLDEPKKKTWLVVLLTVLATLLIAAGAYVAWQSYTADKELKAEEKIETPVVTETEVPVTDTTPIVENVVYVTAPEGLNLRKEANASAEVLAIIPIGTKLTILETSGDWSKTTYDSKTGWVAKLYTAETDPLVYKDTTYGFSLTFKAGWGGYKFFEADNEGSTTEKTYFVAIPTTDSAWDETSSGIDKGYASLFVMGVYTKAEWAAIAGGEILPGKLGESDKYVYTYLPGQAHPSDLATQYGEINDIIKTFETF